MLDRQTSQQIAGIDTVLDFFQWGVNLFNQANCYYGHGTSCAQDDAAAIICYVLAIEPDQLEANKLTHLSQAEKEKIGLLFLKRAKNRIPVVYLTSQTWFAGLSFFVDQRVLIPRSPMAEVIETSFAPWLAFEDIHSVLELGTGSGCIAVATAIYCQKVRVDAVDIDANALDVAKINIERHGVSDQVNLILSDLFEQLEPNKYDIIISNPPYVPGSSMEKLPTEYRHEPVAALIAGKDGLDYVLRILCQAGAYLQPHGVLIVEVGESADALKKAFPQVQFIWLEFDRGGDGVFLLGYKQVVEHNVLFNKVKQRLNK